MKLINTTTKLLCLITSTILISVLMIGIAGSQATIFDMYVVYFGFILISCGVLRLNVFDNASIWLLIVLSPLILITYCLLYIISKCVTDVNTNNVKHENYKT